LCVLMLGHGTPNVEKDPLLVLLRELSMVVMIRCTCNIQGHYLHSSSAIPPVERRERELRNSIGGVNFSGPQPLSSTFLEMSLGGVDFLSFVVEQLVLNMRSIFLPS
jgi:hypothetical protein